MPRRLSSTSRSLSSSSLRAVSSARISCELADFACTARNQPIRMSCAIPRASLRSVLTTIADNAALTWRVSKSTTPNPACVRPAYSQCDRGPASSPMRVTGKPNPLKNVTRTCGSVATFASLTILPAASTTHTLDCSKDTSIPASYCIGCLPELRCFGPTLNSLDPVSSSYRETAAFASRSDPGPITPSSPRHGDSHDEGSNEPIPHPRRLREG